ncbi:MAG: division/cell wall cluster transcriptional repressor MraZ [Firmicutes bacterium]|nr:division/cell wall cluster transcriptional repressor MraZ [Bacillota bacterium]
MLSKFYSQATLQLDTKNRVRIPPLFKRAFEDLQEIYIFQDINDSLALMTELSFEAFATKFDNIPECDVELQNAKESIFSNVKIVPIDNQMRFVIPQELMEISGLTRGVVFKGAGDRLRLYPEEGEVGKDVGKKGSVNRAYGKINGSEYKF